DEPGVHPLDEQRYGLFHAIDNLAALLHHAFYPRSGSHIWVALTQSRCRRRTSASPSIGRRGMAVRRLSPCVRDCRSARISVWVAPALWIEIYLHIPHLFT
ncbi:MAG: hypothetical protein PHT74_06235, partial [Methanoculleus horonobensis]|nr:hypothetical protein [Methanoculleus horonobensis]